MHSLSAKVAGQFAARGEGEVCAVFKRSFYLRFADNAYACVGDESIGRGPLNAIVEGFAPPSLGDKVALSADSVWQPGSLIMSAFPDFYSLREAARGRAPIDGFGCLVARTHNALSAHAQPALDAVDDWIAGNALDARAEQLIGLGPGLTPAGDDYLGGVMVALHLLDRSAQAASLWRWIEPRMAQRSNPISAAHLAAAAAGEAHEALHDCLSSLFQREADWDALLERLQGSAWNTLAGALAVLQKQRY
ncbi:MAG TPA: DUF2877 domain-containing protein [Burkholderiales bacterium]|nr:DUF2877 domain-containing protein [Burkholderiales bacterium]